MASALVLLAQGHPLARRRAQGDLSGPARLRLERVDLLAHDWGAWIGFMLALDHPERIGHYLALNIYPPWPEPPSPGGVLGLWRLLYQVAIAAPGIGSALIRRTDFVRRLVRAGAVHEDAWSEEALDAFSSVLREPARATASVRLYRTFLAHELPELVAQRAVALFDGASPAAIAGLAGAAATRRAGEPTDG
jgi:pimeloyl-ACP methyl ester carboxylesterase